LHVKRSRLVCWSGGFVDNAKRTTLNLQRSKCDWSMGWNLGIRAWHSIASWKARWDAHNLVSGTLLFLVCAAHRQTEWLRQDKGVLRTLGGLPRRAARARGEMRLGSVLEQSEGNSLKSSAAIAVKIFQSRISEIWGQTRNLGNRTLWPGGPEQAPAGRSRPAGAPKYGDRHDVRHTDRERTTSNVQLSTFNGVTERADAGVNMGTDTQFARLDTWPAAPDQALVGPSRPAGIRGQTRCPAYRSGTYNVQRSTLNLQRG